MFVCNNYCVYLGLPMVVFFTNFVGNPTTTTTYLPTTTSTDAATTNLPTTTSTEVHDTLPLPNTSSTSTEGDVTVPTGVDDLSTTVPETEESSKGEWASK